jgi:hypothetical protein
LADKAHAGAYCAYDAGMSINPSEDKDISKEQNRRDDATRSTLNSPRKPNRDYLGKSAPPPRREPKGAKGKGR